MIYISNLIGSAREIQRDGTWFRDAKNRYVLFRGVNLASRSKIYPYLPIIPLNIINWNEIEDQFDQELNQLEHHFDTMKELGFNIVRLLLMWKAIEPTRQEDPCILSKEGTRYLGYINKIINVLYARGIFVIIDFHQDVAHEIFDGDGFPDWVLNNKQWLEAFHSNTNKNKMWQLQYLVNPFVISTLQEFWQNKKPLLSRTHLEQTIGATARFFQSLNEGNGHPAILGYELFNEPHPVGFDKNEFETIILPEYYQNTINEIRSNSKRFGDDDSFIFVEPRIDSTIRSLSDEKFKLLSFIMSLDSKFEPSQLKDPKIVLSFHYYDPLLFIPILPKNLYERSKEWKKIFREITRWVQSKNVIPFLTEFGADQSLKQFQNTSSKYHDLARATMNEQYRYVEENLLNATYWNYDFYNTEDNHDNWNLEDYSILGPQKKLRNEDIVARPYPMRSSAKPKSISFDLNTKLCIMKFNSKLESQSETMIYIPFDIHYKNGFDVYATCGDTRFDKENSLLFWNITNSKKYEIIICPQTKFEELENSFHVHKRY